MIFGDRIKQARELKGWTQTELADKLKVTQPFVAQMEGQVEPTITRGCGGDHFSSGFPAVFF